MNSNKWEIYINKIGPNSNLKNSPSCLNYKKYEIEENQYWNSDKQSENI